MCCVFPHTLYSFRIPFNYSGRGRRSHRVSSRYSDPAMHFAHHTHPRAFGPAVQLALHTQTRCSGPVREQVCTDDQSSATKQEQANLCAVTVLCAST